MDVVASVDGGVLAAPWARLIARACAYVIIDVLCLVLVASMVLVCVVFSVVSCLWHSGCVAFGDLVAVCCVSHGVGLFLFVLCLDRI